MKNYFDLKGQVAIVTGCSTGLGVQMAKALASQGATVVALARRKDKIEAVAQEIAETYKVDTLAVQCDITDTEKVNAAVDEVLAKFGRIDIVINNAGTGGVTPAEDVPDEMFQNEMKIDLFGTFKVARAVAKKAMIPAKYGRIINIASMYGLVGNKHHIMLQRAALLILPVPSHQSGANTASQLTQSARDISIHHLQRKPLILTSSSRMQKQ